MINILTLPLDLYKKRKKAFADRIRILKIKKPYISSPFGWGLDGGSQRIYRAKKFNHSSRQGI